MSQGYSVISWDRKDWKEGNTVDYNGEEEEMWKQTERYLKTAGQDSS